MDGGREGGFFGPEYDKWRPPHVGLFFFFLLLLTQSKASPPSLARPFPHTFSHSLSLSRRFWRHCICITRKEGEDEFAELGVAAFWEDACETLDATDGCLFTLQGLVILLFPGLKILITAVAYHLCLNMPAALLKLGNGH